MGRAGVSEEAMRAQLASAGFSQSRIDEAVAREFGRVVPCDAPRGRDMVPSMAPRAFPIRLTLPWSALVSDNNRKRPTVMLAGTERRPHPRMALTPEYKVAAEKIRTIARRAMQDCPPIEGDLRLVAKVYRPSGRRCDVANLAKGVHDALSKIVYRDDMQLQDTRWMLAGEDTDRPRAEIEITPL